MAPASGYLAATFFGLGVGGLLVMLPVAWGDYFGRGNYGAIRGVALTGQVLAQASGPLLSGVLRDATGGTRRRWPVSPCCPVSARWRRCWRTRRVPDCILTGSRYAARIRCLDGIESHARHAHIGPRQGGPDD